MPFDSRSWSCPKCGAPLKIELNLDKIAFKKSSLVNRVRSIWRYKELIPVKTKDVVSLGEGFTKIIRRRVFGALTYLKLEYLSPSGSFKDRGSSVAVTHAREIGAKTLVEDSSGNAGSSVALYALSAGLKARIYVPKDAPENKRMIIRIFGAQVVECRSREEASSRAVHELRRDDYYIGHLWNPFFIEGMKTMAFEIAEQFKWERVDCIIAPIASGSLVLGLFKGFKELEVLGLINDLPSLVGVQAEGWA
ncbi:threonine synthase, partial [Candidatus Geothermarchaeota archaeon]